MATNPAVCTPNYNFSGWILTCVDLGFIVLWRTERWSMRPSDLGQTSNPPNFKIHPVQRSNNQHSTSTTLRTTVSRSTHYMGHLEHVGALWLPTGTAHAGGLPRIVDTHCSNAVQLLLYHNKQNKKSKRARRITQLAKLSIN